MKILCAIDGKDHSLRAGHVACDLAKRLGAELLLCMVNPLLPGRGPPISLWPEEYVATVLADANRRAMWSGVKPARTETWRAISISDTIATYADEQDIDYIVVGSSDRSWLSKVLSGSVSRELAQKANCPVLIVHRLRGDRPIGGGRRVRVRDLAAESPRAAISTRIAPTRSASDR